MLFSDSFVDKSIIPIKYANLGIKGGENISPQLSWKNSPKETKSYAIICVDIAPIANNWIHWAVFNIPGTVTQLSEGASGNNMPEGALEIHNSFRSKGYGGPQPPKGSGVHTYVFTIYALNTPKIELTKSFLTYDEILTSLRSRIISKSTYCGTFKQ